MSPIHTMVMCMTVLSSECQLHQYHDMTEKKIILAMYKS